MQQQIVNNVSLTIAGVLDLAGGIGPVSKALGFSGSLLLIWRKGRSGKQPRKPGIPWEHWDDLIMLAARRGETLTVQQIYDANKLARSTVAAPATTTP